jgi:hypothetical protein
MSTDQGDGVSPQTHTFMDIHTAYLEAFSPSKGHDWSSREHFRQRNPRWHLLWLTTVLQCSGIPLVLVYRERASPKYLLGTLEIQATADIASLRRRTIRPFLWLTHIAVSQILPTPL